MLNRPIKYAFFLLYTLLIFQSYVFALVPAAIYYDFNILRLRFLATVFFPCLIIPFVLARSFFFDIPKMLLKSFPDELISTLLTLTLYFIIPLALSCKLFYWWFKKQYPLTAWGIAFLGSCYAFLIFPSTLTLGDGGHKDGFGWVALPAVNCFYFVLCIADLLQKELWPDNKFANKIRSLLSIPCIHPSNCREALSETDSKVKNS